MAVTVEAVQGILAGLIDPNTKKDYIASRSAKNIKVDGDKAHLIRRRETVEELYALESLLP